MLGEVRLEVPACAAYFRVARMVAAGVGSRLGFTLDELDDLRIAVDELCAVVMGGHTEGTLRLRYQLEDDAITVEGEAEFPDASRSAPELSPVSDMILGAVVDECQVSVGDDGPTFRMVKRRVPRP
jgi:serine/threonine-protein kinase RsbW